MPDLASGDLVITVCDMAHETLCSGHKVSHIHWSVPDPVISKAPKAFAQTIDLLSERINAVSSYVRLW